jgi:hypothetical protein
METKPHFPYVLVFLQARNLQQVNRHMQVCYKDMLL